MEGIVAKRCLRESRISTNYDKKYKVFNKKDSINSLYRKSAIINRRINNEDSKQKSLIDKVVFKAKMKLWVQAISALCLLVIVISCSMINVKVINDNKYIKWVKSEYKKEYDITSIKKEIKKLFIYCYKGVLKIVPDRVENSMKSIYRDAKGKFIENKESSNLSIYQDESDKEVKEESKVDLENTGVGASIDEEEKVEFKEAVSAISSQDTYLKYIKDNNIKFIMPTKGNITSGFGAREEIFSDIDSYHTGIDIANKKGTDIIASHDGKVTKVSNNKYNGNFVEITNGKVITKYAHMDSVSIKQGASVKAGSVIGKMGETGYATGPHLHFEVVVDGVKIDPTKVLNM